MRKRRIELGLSQTSVANELKVSFQQIQKYEKGRNRIAASRLVMLSKLLNVSPEFFFAEPEERDAAEEARSMIDVAASIASKDGIRLNKAFQRIADVDLRKKLVEFIEAISRRYG